MHSQLVEPLLLLLGALSKHSILHDLLELTGLCNCCPALEAVVGLGSQRYDGRLLDAGSQYAGLITVLVGVGQGRVDEGGTPPHLRGRSVLLATEP